MWKANIKSIEKDNISQQVAKITFVYINSDGRSKVITERISDPNSIKIIAKNGIKELQRQDDINDLILNPKLGEINFTEPIAELTPEQKAEEDFTLGKEKLKEMKENVYLGLSEQTEYDLLLAKIKNTLKSNV